MVNIYVLWSSHDLLDISVSRGLLCIKYQVLRAETESVLRSYFSHSTIFFFHSTLPSRSHEVPPYCLALFLFCDPADMDVKIFFSVATRLQLSVYKVQFSFYAARETREIVVRVRNDPRSKPTFKKFNIEEFPVIYIDCTTKRLV